MEDTLFNEERMFVEKVSYWFKAPRRGDVIICYYPGYTESCVKRVIGLPGETIAIQDGQVYIDNQLLDESEYWEGYIYGDYPPTEIPEDCVFVMGDNRNASGDSRVSSVGSIPYHRIMGRARSVIWPLNRIRGL